MSSHAPVRTLDLCQPAIQKARRPSNGPLAQLLDERQVEPTLLVHPTHSIEYVDKVSISVLMLAGRPPIDLQPTINRGVTIVPQLHKPRSLNFREALASLMFDMVG